MGFSRQLTAEEIFEQVAIYDSLVKQNGDSRGVTNVVFMGMGEPLANYRNVLKAVRMINAELGIGARKITVSTVGLAPNILKLAQEDVQVNLAVSLHESDDAKRSLLLPANARYGGLDVLMEAIKTYVDTTRRRVSFEWALIAGENDTPATARALGKLFRKHKIESALAHVNVIPLNPTEGFSGSKSNRDAVDGFCKLLGDEFGISATPRMRKGIDIDAGCGQLKAEIVRKGGGQVYEGFVDVGEGEEKVVDKVVDVVAVRKTTTITDPEEVEKAAKKVKKIKSKLKQIKMLEDKVDGDEAFLNDGQRDKIARKEGLERELEDLVHNLA